MQTHKFLHHCHVTQFSVSSPLTEMPDLSVNYFKPLPFIQTTANETQHSMHKCFTMWATVQVTPSHYCPPNGLLCLFINIIVIVLDSRLSTVIYFVLCNCVWPAWSHQMGYEKHTNFLVISWSQHFFCLLFLSCHAIKSVLTAAWCHVILCVNVIEKKMWGDVV